MLIKLQLLFWWWDLQCLLLGHNWLKNGFTAMSYKQYDACLRCGALKNYPKG